MTEKLYYTASHQREFDAVVIDCEKSKKGWEVILDKTVFYPEGGGQPSDHGILGGVRVLDVHEKGGIITHLCDGELAVGSTVHGEIDWDRRFDLMQQHSGEHLVSGLVHEKYGYSNVGFHMGADLITIDFNGMIDEAGLRGKGVGKAAVSEKHAGFVVNLGGATAADVLATMAYIQEKVSERFGVMLEPEVRIW